MLDPIIINESTRKVLLDNLNDPKNRISLERTTILDCMIHYIAAKTGIIYTGDKLWHPINHKEYVDDIKRMYEELI